MLNLPTDIQGQAAQRYANQRKTWLQGGGSFPFSLVLGNLTEAKFMANLKAVKVWHDAWRAWAGAGRVDWEEYRWARAGAHVLPHRIVFNSPEEVAAVAGKTAEWALVQARLTELAGLGTLPVASFAKFCDLVLSYAEPEWDRLVRCLAYFMANPASNLYVRQLPIEGVDTKWLGAHKADVTKLLRHLKSLAGDADFYDVCGLRRPPHCVRIRLLCPTLRAQVGGLSDIAVPVAELVDWRIRPSRLVIIENLESGLALEDMPGTMVIIGMGNAVTELAKVEWLANLPALYWGDLDTHGLAIWHRASQVLPRLRPVLMDLDTLLAYPALWVLEPSQHPPIPDMTPAQQAVFTRLTEPGNAQSARLEQERIPWQIAASAVATAFSL